MVFILGLGSAALIYQRAENRGEEVLGYDESGNVIRPDDSKEYLRSMELYGGKANVLADKLRRRFLGLWQGKSLAVIIALVTIITSLGFFYGANYLPERPKSENHGKDQS